MPESAARIELARERETLTKADLDIASGERRIARQRELIERMRCNGQITKEAEGLLELFLQTQKMWRDHRELIVERIAYLTAHVGGKRPGEGGSLPG